MKAREIAIGGLLVALQILTLALAYVIPTIKLALLFIAALYPGVLLRIGVKRSLILSTYISSSVFSVFLIQIPEMQIGFILFFGWYGLIHELTLRFQFAKKQIVRWGVFAFAGACAYIAARYLIDIDIKYSYLIISLFAAAAFALMQIIYELTLREFIKKTKIRLDNGNIVFK